MTILDDRIAYEGTRVMARHHLTSALAWFSQGEKTNDAGLLNEAINELETAKRCMERLMALMPDEVVEE